MNLTPCLTSRYTPMTAAMFPPTCWLSVGGLTRGQIEPMPKAISHTVKHPGKAPGDPDVEIPIAKDLVTVPGIPAREKDVSFYSRMYPLEAQSLEKSADREWEQTVWSDELAEFHKKHHERNRALVDGAESSGDLEPTGKAEPGRDLTEDIRTKARQLGAGEVGFAKLDRRYVYASRRDWVKYPHAVCLAVEQDHERTPDDHQHRGRAYSLRRLRGDRSPRLGTDRLHPRSGLPRSDAQSQ